VWGWFGTELPARGSPTPPDCGPALGPVVGHDGCSPASRCTHLITVGLRHTRRDRYGLDPFVGACQRLHRDFCFGGEEVGGAPLSRRGRPTDPAPRRLFCRIEQTATHVLWLRPPADPPLKSASEHLVLGHARRLHERAELVQPRELPRGRRIVPFAVFDDRRRRRREVALTARAGSSTSGERVSIRTTVRPRSESGCSVWRRTSVLRSCSKRWDLSSSNAG
jgi:hypothetical protein